MRLAPIILATLVAYLLFACSESSDSAPGFDAGFDAGAEGSTVAACDVTGVTPGTTMEQVDPEGFRSRTYQLHVPEGYDDTPRPLVINMHGFLNDGSQQSRISGMNALADEEGFIAVYPDGLGTLRAFNAGDCCAWDNPEQDDVAFIDQVIERVSQQVCVDRSRIYATGFSNGGFMAYRLACERSETFAAVASVSGVLGIPREDCDQARPVPLLHIHGTADLIVPYQGGSPTGIGLIYQGTETPVFRSVEESFDTYLGVVGCDQTPFPGEQIGAVSCDIHRACTGGVELELCTIEGGGHTWPGGDPQVLSEAFGVLAFALGVTNQDMDASRRIWSFFERYQL
ncbi:MAG: PHB depolymerase family esterase [Myxococcales bacterium]|jgi:polyhydroxybutyrate depolymerase